MLGWDIRDVERGQIHRHAAQDRRASTADRRMSTIADGAHQTVRISQSDRCEHAWPLRHEGGSVANAPPTVNAAELQDARGQERGYRERIDRNVLDVAATESDSRPHQIEGVRLSEQYATG